MHAAVFLDRDGVLIEEVYGLTQLDQIRLLDGAPEALSALKGAGFKLIVVTNQPVIARGLAKADDVNRVHAEINRRLEEAGGQAVDAFYFCPHHPHATLPEYRVDCDCRKPRAGMLLRAAAEHDIDTARSYMIGDRITDIIAGQQAGCRSILVETGAHREPPIRTPEPVDPSTRPDRVCRDLGAAAGVILAR